MSSSLTQAAKDLGISQPSLSQHLAKLEDKIENRLFDRRGNQLTLSDVGGYLLERANHILAEAEETEARLAEFADGTRGRISIGVLPSVGRSLMAPALAEMAIHFPDLELDLHELSPLEALDRLYAHNIHMAVLSRNALAANRLSFTEVKITEDPYVLAVPMGLELDDVRNPDKDLSASSQKILRRTVMFDFGSHHNQRIEEIYRQLIPHHQMVVRCRSYETALAIVESGQGVAIAPQLALEHAGRRLFNVRAYELPMAKRQLAVFAASQYMHVSVYKTFTEVLHKCGPKVPRGPLTPAAPFMSERLAKAGA